MIHRMTGDFSQQQQSNNPNKSPPTIPISALPVPFRPKRFNEQCHACKKWGHRSNSCFILAQYYWVMNFCTLNPSFAKDIATKYATHNDKSVRKPMVQVLRSMPQVSALITEDDLIHHITSDDIFCTDVAEPIYRE